MVKSNRVGEAAPRAAEPKAAFSVQNTEDVYAEGTSKLVWSRPSPDLFGSSYPTADVLPAGLYRLDQHNSGIFFHQIHYENDVIIPLPNSASAAVMKEITQFWDKHDLFTERGLVHKRGVLMVGPQGSGKTATVAQLIGLIIDQHDGLAVFLDSPELAAAGLQMLRRIEPDRPVVCILEDIDALIKRHGESEYLALLDGESQIDRVVFVATTNYPERLDKRITNRPSRFDLVIEVPSPSAADRETYIRAKEPGASAAQIKRWIAMTDGYSIAHLREFLILVAIFGKSEFEAKARLDKMRVGNPTSDRLDDGVRSGNFGFTGGAKANEAGPQHYGGTDDGDDDEGVDEEMPKALPAFP